MGLGSGEDGKEPSKMENGIVYFPLGSSEPSLFDGKISLVRQDRRRVKYVEVYPGARRKRRRRVLDTTLYSHVTDFWSYKFYTCTGSAQGRWTSWTGESPIL